MECIECETKKDFKQKLQTWKQKSKDQKNRIRKQFKEFQNLPDTTKQLLRNAYEDFKHLPPDKQKSLLTMHNESYQ